MNLVISTCILLIAVLQLCTSQDYLQPTYNPEVSSPSSTNDYLSNDPRYDNPYDPNKRYQNRNQNPYDVNRNPYDPNRSQYDKDQRYNQFENRSPDLNNNQYSSENTPRPSWDSGRTYSTSYKGAALEHESVIINEA